MKKPDDVAAAIADVEKRTAAIEGHYVMVRDIYDRLYDVKRDAAVEYGFPQELVDHYFPPRSEA